MNNNYCLYFLGVVVSIALLMGCKPKTEQLTESRTVIQTPEVDGDDTGTLAYLTIGGVKLVGESQDSIIRKFISMFKHMELVEHKEDTLSIVSFCNVPCGFNVNWSTNNNQIAITSILLFTSQKDKNTFDRLKQGITELFGEPDVEEYEEGKEEYEGRFSGRCTWYKDCSITLRHSHGEEGGFLLIFEK